MGAALHPAFWIGLAVFLLQTAIITALLVERRLRRRAEAQNRAILASMAADLAVVNRDGMVEACNENWSRTVDTSNPFMSARVGEQWIRSRPVLPAENQADLHRIREALDLVMSGREDERTVEYVWQDGARRKWSHLRLRRMDRHGGGAVVSHVDITKRKRMEAEARNALHEVAHLNMRAGLGELVSAVTHELRQSLTASMSNAQALKRMLVLERMGYEDLSPIIDDISDANRHATDVIGRIRALMRKEEFDMRPLDINAIVMDVVQLLHSSAASEGVLLVADLDPDLPPIAGDRIQLRQVVMNLVLNAVQASRGTDTVPPIVRVVTAFQNRRVSVVVEDAGPGVTDDAMPKLFEPYFTTKHDGLGVGLSISRSIVESHGGSIGVANLPKGGARFDVTFPLE